MILTHGDVGQFVSGAVRVDTVQVRTITIHSTKNQSCANIALIPDKKNSTLICLCTAETSYYI